ncbi:IclR family transcriptional regulator [Nonomuraea lactucae]|uniref:IclR family transcriptional regulator n=1 Tax=Nonomuraea lactucae TaxID=2249762 RepID=UPI0013B35B5F|nr:IclR family transcriptional regulator [Nonomuraea lactucae]
MTEQDARPGEIAQTLDRGLQILECLGGRSGGLSVAEVAEAIGVHRSIAARLLTTLDRRGYVERRRGRYSLGFTLLSLARMSSAGITAVAMPLLEETAEKFDVTSVLHVVDGEEAVTLASVESPRATFHIGLRVGARTPLNVAAHGLAILAGREPRQGERPEVTRARSVGYAVTTGEVVPGYSGISSPVVVNGRCDASVGIVVPPQRGEFDITELGPAMAALAQRLALVLG